MDFTVNISGLSEGVTLLLHHATTHPKIMTYVHTLADELAMHVVLCREKQEVHETCAFTVE